MVVSNYFLFLPLLGEINLTCAYFSNGLVETNHQPEQHRPYQFLESVFTCQAGPFKEPLPWKELGLEDYPEAPAGKAACGHFHQVFKGP